MVNRSKVECCCNAVEPKKWQLFIIPNFTSSFPRGIRPPKFDQTLYRRIFFSLFFGGFLTRLTFYSLSHLTHYHAAGDSFLHCFFFSSCDPVLIWTLTGWLFINDRTPKFTPQSTLGVIIFHGKNFVTIPDTQYACIFTWISTMFIIMRLSVHRLVLTAPIFIDKNLKRGTSCIIVRLNHQFYILSTYRHNSELL